MPEDTVFSAGTVAESPGPSVPGTDAEVPSVPSASDIEVEPDKLLDVAEVIRSQADALRERVRGQLEALRIEQPSIDIVSVHAVQGWNTLVAEGEGSYYRRVLDYIDGLHNLAEQLRAAGERYRASDDEKAASVARAGEGR